jgi:hypothetical protein
VCDLVFARLQNEIKTLRNVLETEKDDPNVVKAQVDRLGAASTKIGEHIYKSVCDAAARCHAHHARCAHPRSKEEQPTSYLHCMIRNDYNMFSRI